jgi:transcriptional regulator with XRE-family HTH domain
LRTRDLALAVGCDESMISKIEAGKVMPSLPMLNTMVHALDRDMASFFGLKIDEYKLVQKSEERLKVPIDALRGGTGVTYERLVPVAAGYLVSGTIELTIDDTTYLMSPGDSFFCMRHEERQQSADRSSRLRCSRRPGIMKLTAASDVTAIGTSFASSTAQKNCKP